MIFRVNKDLAISSGKALCCSAYAGENDQRLAQVRVSNIPFEQDFTLQSSQIRDGGIPETRPSEDLSAQCSIWQVRSGKQPGHTGELLPVGSFAWIPITLAIQLSYLLLWLNCHQTRNPDCPFVVDVTFYIFRRLCPFALHHTCSHRMRCLFGICPWHRWV